MYTFQVGSVIKCENQLKRRAHNCTIASNGKEEKNRLRAKRNNFVRKRKREKDKGTKRVWRAKQIMCKKYKASKHLKTAYLLMPYANTTCT